MAKHVADEKSCHPLGVDVFPTGDEERCLGAVVVSDGENGVVVSGLRELGNKIHCNYFEGEGPCLREDGVQGCFGGASVDLVSLTFRASPDILHDILPEPRPPMGPLYQVCSATDPWMSVGWGVVSVMNKLSKARGLSSDYHSPILPPLPIDEFQLVQVNPLLNGFFVLFALFVLQLSHKHLVW